MNRDKYGNPDPVAVMHAAAAEAAALAAARQQAAAEAEAAARKRQRERAEEIRRENSNKRRRDVHDEAARQAAAVGRALQGVRAAPNFSFHARIRAANLRRPHRPNFHANFHPTVHAVVSLCLGGRLCRLRQAHPRKQGPLELDGKSQQP